jgi:hypothetical protein
MPTYTNTSTDIHTPPNMVRYVHVIPFCKESLNQKLVCFVPKPPQTDRQTDKTNGHTDAQMDTQIYGQLEGHRDGQTDKWTNRLMNRQTYCCLPSSTDGRMDRQTDRQTDRCMNGQTSRQTDTQPNLLIVCFVLSGLLLLSECFLSCSLFFLCPYFLLPAQSQDSN